MDRIIDEAGMEERMKEIRMNIENSSKGIYTPPTPEDLAFIMDINGWSQIDVAKLVGASYSQKHGSTTVRKWCSPKGSKEHRQISYPAWRLLLSYSIVGKSANKEDAARIIGRNYGGK